MSASKDQELRQQSAEPPLPPYRMFVVRRYNLVGEGIEEVFVHCHTVSWGHAGEVIFQDFIKDATYGIVQQTVRSFREWIDIEAMPVTAPELPA